ncbi:MAG: NAD(P)(+) transhydrogenase (Re/Si-specific) subunit beta [Candidatus Marinimicrobia bacterium]|nr:NAD(P)(+) transhydrogenase (Re/Si-specific) subunit beta [Candidatus Neomarinimicrobiota bacterium]MCF7904713.1 NAD(P)(+) transhydrogenase (Re/Si-specific) subunit beta [Candidatus Neomarinimicrobiota bacterium]
MIYLEQFSYLFASALFILGLKFLGSAKTARKGMQLAMYGMGLAIVITLVVSGIAGPVQIIVGMLIGGGIGAVVAKKIQMTSMPQMVALFNGFGGIASTLVAYSEYIRFTGAEAMDVNITVILSLFIGTVTFTGSLIAFAKLQGIMRGAPIVLPLHQILNILLLLGTITFGVMNVLSPDVHMWAWFIIAAAAIFGITFVIPIGGADMPVVIALLNSYSGLAAAATGFVLSNNVLIISGALVGASGLILTQLMCDAMNRSLTNVLFGAVGTDDSTGEAGAGGEQKSVTAYTAEDAAMIMDTIQSVIIVPGYGLAVAQAQHVLHELGEILTARGIDVKYAIHPVAGRMPGHMNVLLAEANVPYDVLYEMDDINDEFQNTDVALVIGANDVVNPSARTKKDSPLYGMPILNVDYASTVMFVKRSMGAGFAGEANPLFFDDKTMMVFGDAKAVVTALVKSLKED